tara:strand:- start:283 stop:612 length:330 start_codon:yes stop_codon:yes gene_type:complete
MLTVKGYRLLVKAKEIERVSGGGIIISVEGTNQDRLEQTGNQIGTVVGVGHTCWKGSVDDTPWCEVGDDILYSKHAGRFVFDPVTDEKFLTINDDDVIAVIQKGTDNVT